MITLALEHRVRATLERATGSRRYPFVVGVVAFVSTLSMSVPFAHNVDNALWRLGAVSDCGHTIAADARAGHRRDHPTAAARSADRAAHWQADQVRGLRMAGRTIPRTVRALASLQLLPPTLKDDS